MTRIKAWFKNSLTIFWARFQVATGIVLGIAGQVADVLQAANVGQILPPQWASYVLVGMGVITELARRRKEWQS